jgi:type II secretory pathway pseudopilin PulG
MNVHSQQRGMTIVELLISFGILLLVLGLATALFTQAFRHSTMTTENMTNEQLARVAMARINNTLSQATVDVNSVDTNNGTPAPSVIGSVTFPSATSTPAIAFFRVQTLNPSAMPTGSTNAPNPSYWVHIISYDPVGKQINEYVTTWANYNANGASPAPVALAYNVTNFGVMQVTTSEYQFQITLDNTTNPTQAEAPYTLVDNVHLLN